jgi:hypothetical protein
MLNFREWFYFNESIEANIDNWINGVIDPKRPDGTPIPLPPNEAELNNFQVTQQQKQLMIDNLNKFDLSNPVDSGKRKLKITANHVKFLLGFIKSKPQALTEDYERALDALFWALSSNKVTKQQFGLESYNIGKNIQRYIEEKDREEGPSKREEERDKKEGKGDDIDPLYVENNIKCYHLPKIKSDLSEDEKKKAISERHKLLCKYGKNTGWCTASPSGTYHEIYKYDEIYIIHVDSIPVYQFVHCTKTVKSKNCQFMDINDRMPKQPEFIKMSYSVYNFIKKYFPEVFEYYELEQYGMDEIGKMVMDLENNDEDSVLQKIQKFTESGDFEIDVTPVAQYYIDNKKNIPNILKEFILKSTDIDCVFIANNFNNPLVQEILHLNKIKYDKNTIILINYLVKNNIEIPDKIADIFIKKEGDKILEQKTNFIIENISHPFSKRIVQYKFLQKNNEDYVKKIIKETKNKNEMIKLITDNIEFINESIIKLLQKYTKDKIEDLIVKNNKFGFLVFSNYYRERMMEISDKKRNYYGQIPKELLEKDDEDTEEYVKKSLELLNKSAHPEKITDRNSIAHVISLLMQSINPIRYKNLIPNNIIKNTDHYEIERLVSFARKPIEALEVIGKEIVNDKIRIEIFNDLQKFDNEKKLEGAKIILMFTDFLDDRQINFVKKCIEKSTLSETNKEEIYNLIEKYKTS